MVTSEIRNIAIRGISVVVPPAARRSEQLASLYGDDDVRKLAASTGVAEVRIASKNQTASDLCAVAAKHLLDRLGWDAASIGLLVFVTQMPDYVLPSTGCVLHGRLGLSKSALSVDISQGCSGYVTGLWTAASILSNLRPRRALLLVGDTISKVISAADRATSILFGDAGTATALEWDERADMLDFVGGTDGTGAAHLIVSTGGFRTPTRPDGARADSPWSLGAISMNGPEVFAFTTREVTQLFKLALERRKWTVDEVDPVVFHQANKFLLDHLRKKLKIDVGRFPISLSRYGNTSSASIPLTLAAMDQATHRTQRCLLAGFGVGFSWASCTYSLVDTLILPIVDSDEVAPPLGA